MGAGVTTRGNGAAEAAGAGAALTGRDGSWRAKSVGLRDEPPRDALSLRVTEDRVLIRADREDHVPTLSEAGLYTASSMAAAVEGSDEADSWFVGTIMQIGPLVNHFDLRAFVLRQLYTMEDCGHDLCSAEIKALRARIEALPEDCPEPLRLGDRVVFSWVSGQQIAVDGDRYLILRAGDVLGVIEA